jgi:hypothetical protein
MPQKGQPRNRFIPEQATTEKLAVDRKNTVNISKEECSRILILHQINGFNAELTSLQTGLSVAIIKKLQNSLETNPAFAAFHTIRKTVEAGYLSPILEMIAIELGATLFEISQKRKYATYGELIRGLDVLMRNYTAFIDRIDDAGENLPDSFKVIPETVNYIKKEVSKWSENGERIRTTEAN